MILSASLARRRRVLAAVSRQARASGNSFDHCEHAIGVDLMNHRRSVRSQLKAKNENTQ